MVDTLPLSKKHQHMQWQTQKKGVCAFSVPSIFASTCTKTPTLWVQHLLGKQEPTIQLSYRVHAHHPHHSFDMFLLLLLVASQAGLYWGF